MSLFRKENIDIDKISSAGFQPQQDRVLIYLWEQAIKGRIPAYLAQVPFALIEPYDKHYNFNDHPVGQQVVKAIIDQNRNRTVWVYPEGDKYILSDDYPAYCAAVESSPEFVPCWILGKPDDDRLKDIQGPIGRKEIRQIIFE